MRPPIASYSLFFLSFVIFVKASPLVNVPSSLVLNFANGNNTGPHLPSNTTDFTNDALDMSTVFPPYPPPSPFNYHVPYSYIGLKFALYSTLSLYNQTAVDIIMRTAIRDSVNPFRPQDPVPWTHHIWESNRYWLDMSPMGRFAPHLRFNYDMWTASLTGINNFVLAYPGLFFHYQVFLEDEYGDTGACLAIGGLQFTWRLDPAEPASTM